MRDYGDARFGRFLLYLLIYRNNAQDWDSQGHRIGFEGLAVLAGFRPQWHHIFPTKYLEGKVEEPLIDALANIAVIGPSINIRISASEPLSYVTKYAISAEKLKQQYIDPDFTHVSTEQFPNWLESRAERLAQASNQLMDELRCICG